VITVFVVLVGLLVIGGLLGRVAEQRHVKRLEEREARLAGFPVTDLNALPPGATAARGRMVLGEAVIASDYLKTFLAGLRGLVGGEVRTYQTLLTRARREARLRMIEQAVAEGAMAVVNIRYETSRVGSLPSAEVVCYGTAMYRNG
jgi:uncharacterized protein YbjQ (UPF0145 family)